MQVNETGLELLGTIAEFSKLRMHWIYEGEGMWFRHTEDHNDGFDAGENPQGFYGPFNTLYEAVWGLGV